jgi:TolB-like protein/Tfp pilus assembly protein PilF
VSFFNELKRRNVFKVAVAYIIVGWLIMQVGDTLGPALLLPEWINSALAFFIILGFPLAMFFAWAFEMTPEGIKKEQDVDRSESITHVTSQKLNNAIIGLLVLALGYFAFDKFVLDPGRDAAQIEEAIQVAEEQSSAPEESGPPELSIAVLPFVNMSADANNEYFSDGLTEELLNILAKIQELQVAGRTSSFAFKNKQEDLRGIGEQLNVKSILEGSVRKDDQRNRVRITAQLINADDGYHLWSETYDRELDDIFAIQEEIAGEVARALRVTLLGEEESLVTDTEFSAYDLYLKALQQINAGGFAQLDEAVDLLQQAITIDPGYSPARLALVTAWNNMANTGAIPYSEASTRGNPMLESILSEDPGNSDAYVQLAKLRALEEDFEGADEAFNRALEIDPRNNRALREYGRFLFGLGEIERGQALISEALRVDPLDLRIIWIKCQSNAYLGNFELAMEACTRIQELDPESPLGYYGEALTHLYTGDIARALVWYGNAIEKDPGDFEMIGAMSMFWLFLGDPEQARIWLQRAEALGAGQPVPISARMQLYQYLEQPDLARDLAKQALDAGIQDRHGINSFLRHACAYAFVLEGDIESALEPYRLEYPWVFAAELEPPDDYAFMVDDLFVIADLLKRQNPISEQPDQLVRLAEQKINDYPPVLGPWHAEGRRGSIAILRGDYDKAVEHMNRMFEMGSRSWWRTFFIYDPLAMHLTDHPGYQDLIARFEQDMERQRVLAYELLEVKQ